MSCTECDSPYNCKYPKQLSMPSVCINESKKLSNISTKPRKFNWPNSANIKFLPETVKKSVINNMALSAIEEELPTDFSWLANPESIISHGLENQEDCGCCWAFSIASVLSDRYAIAYKKYRPKISVANIIMCANNENSKYECKYSTCVASDQPSSNITQCTCGGNNYESSRYLEDVENGVKLEKCWPYEESVNVLSTMVCPSKLACLICNQDSTTFSLKKDSTTYLAYIIKDVDYEKTILNIKKSIMSEGPVMTNFRVPNNFQSWWNRSYISDIYVPPNQNLSENNSGNHAVTLVGWGKDINTNQEYWIMRNSWGATHAGYGYCKFAITSKETADNYKTGLDIPYKNGMYWEGGTVKFNVSESFLLNGEPWGETIREELTTKPIGDPPNDFGIKSIPSRISNNIKKYWYIYVIILLIIIIFLLFT